MMDNKEYENFFHIYDKYVFLDKEQLLSLAALAIELRQPDWLAEIQLKLRTLS